MRLWSIHPKYLDRVGLIALWREGLLAQKVLSGLTRGYLNHPQLARFRRTLNPLLSIGTYLYYTYLEGLRRGYSFRLERIRAYDEGLRAFIPITTGQLRYEYRLLLFKLRERSPDLAKRLEGINAIDVNPVFYVVEGPVADWEKVKDYVLKELEQR